LVGQARGLGPRGFARGDFKQASLTGPQEAPTL
jgi:hypothetical protein